MNMFHDYKQSLMEVDEGGRATIHYNTHWTKEPMQKTYRSAKHMSDDELKAQHYKLFGGSVTKIERDHEYEPKKEKIHMNDKPGHLMDDIDAHVKPALDESYTLSPQSPQGGTIEDAIEYHKQYHKAEMKRYNTLKKKGVESGLIGHYTKSANAAYDNAEAHKKKAQYLVKQRNRGNYNAHLLKEEIDLYEGVHLVLVNRHTGQRVVIKREHADNYPPRDGWQPISSVQTEATEVVDDTPKHLMTFKSTDERGNSRHFHVYQKNDCCWYSVKGPTAMHANAVFLNGRIGDFEAEQHAQTVANMVGQGQHDQALEHLNKYSTVSWNKDYDQPTAEPYVNQSLQTRSYRMNEASGREVISAKLKTMDAMRRVRIPTPQERRAEFEKQQREKEAEQERLAKPSLAKEETDRMSQYVDLINQDLKNNRY